MVDEVPVRDVLCEAMEYLSKLGSNLRIRSENLKEKRVNREKLINCHAVQKAANKVLRICELSKKSLDNVEAGVKNVLSLITTSQSTANERKTSIDENTSKYKYFHYDSSKLRISKKVPIKHYMSVRVKVKRMRSEMQDNYPVYHDCKLYRLRQRKKRILDNSTVTNNKESTRIDIDENLNNEKPSDSKEDSKKHKSKSHLRHIESKSDNSESVDKISEKESNMDQKKDTEKNYFPHNLEADTQQTDNENKKRKHDMIADDNDAPQLELCKRICNDSKETEAKLNSLDNQNVSVGNNYVGGNEDEVGEVNKEKDLSDLSKEDSINKQDNLSVVENRDSCNKENEIENSIQITEKESNSLSDEPVITSAENESEDQTVTEGVQENFESNDENTMGEITDKGKKKTQRRISSDDSAVEIIAENTISVDSSENNSGKENKKESIIKSNELVTNDNISDKKKKGEMEENEPVKPLIKCVSISKLLKPDVLSKEAIPPNQFSPQKKDRCSQNSGKKKDRTKKLHTEKHTSSLKDKEDEEYWLEKRAEVKAFQSKPFVINTTRLRLSKEFLQEHSLKRIIRGGSVIFEITDSPKREAEQNDEKKEMPHKDLEIAKNALLNDSDSEKSNKIRKSISVENRANDDQNEIKSSLLNDSSDDSSNNQNPRKESPKSRRKRIRESIRARRLANFSSSDSEDEQLEKTVNKIKNHLLEGRSSSEDENDLIKKVNAYHKKKFIKSSSDEDCSDEIPKKTNSNSPKPDDTTSEKENLKGEKEEDNRVDKMVRSKSKPNGASGSQNSDTQDVADKEIDRLTAPITLNKDHQGCGSPGSEEAGNAKLKKKASFLKSVSLTEGGNSDDAASLTGSEPGEAEELPAMTMPSMNGGDHSAKDDLLQESDSSISHHENKESEDSKKDETDDSETVKSKRRKGNTISSDSEAGSSRRKASAKDSDFEDSGDECSDINKKKKRKKKGSDSDASANSSTNEGKKKRRRIKLLNDSDASESDSENEGRNKHGRKNIRKVMGKDQLEEATKKAAREEKERIARIAERQKLYNNMLFDESGKPDEVVLEKVVLDFDPETKEPLIQVDRGLVAKLKPHQANGIKFMWDACFESVKRIKKDKGSGCILAHCMGLGKTLQVVSLTHTLLTHNSLTGVSRVLVVCPLSTVLNWVNEYRIWLKHAEKDDEIDIYELSRFKQNSERAYQLQQWFEGGGICVLGYEMFRNLSADNNKKFKKKMLKNFQEALVDPGPDLVVCDEGHLLKNEKTSLSQSMNRVKTLRRIVLTGTPLQNNLKEYYCMVQFVKPNLLGKYNEYLNRFVNPITNGQYTDSTEHDIRVMKRRSHVLHKMLDGAVQRRDYGVLAPFLPPKHEYVLFITLNEVQVKLYQHYLDNYSRRPLAGKSSGFLFPDFQALQRIWTHPLVLKYNSERYEIMQQKKREREEEDSEGSLVDFIDDDSSTPEESSSEESSDDLSDMSDDSRKKNKKKSLKKKGKESKVSSRRGTRSNPIEIEDEDKNHSEVEEAKNENPTEWWIRLVEEEELDDLRNSHKLVLLFDILRQCETIGDKLLVFSQSLYSLDLIEHFLGKVDEATQEGRIDEKLGGHVGSWSPGVDYFRLDGSTSCENRSIWCKNFNREDNPRARLFLISTRAGGLGINLVAANRVVIFDVSWNPSHDVQSIFRVYRFGQKKPCYVYRFLAMGTMEEKIYERQVTKQAISKRVIDEQQIDRHYAENDLAELYKFEPTPPTPRPLPPLPKDRLFAELLKEHENQIYKYHEHDSLLENKEEETLTEEERKAAWEDFENEKNRPPPAPFAANWPPVHNGMSVWAQQQQQMMLAAVTAMLRKDIPNINDNQIRDMLPHIFNTNPSMFGGYDYGLMQKMAEIYKYPQPGMMNPAMMGAVMNPSGGMSGSSGLQYEPPWQRQHQQQQQMRLQQMMAHQNSSGAKYYAGGLGSRDPIAMALQQQRARQIMGDRGAAGVTGAGAVAVTGAGGASRPRGRPPLQPNPPPQPTAATGDIVDLDSD